MAVKVGPSQGKMKICSESLKEEYKERYTDQLRKIVYGGGDIIMNYISYIINQM
jgi:hypothetical protein